jgi:hypothetical protein
VKSLLLYGEPLRAAAQFEAAVGQVISVLPTALRLPWRVCAQRTENGASAACAGAVTSSVARSAMRMERPRLDGHSRTAQIIEIELV